MKIKSLIFISVMMLVLFASIFAFSKPDTDRVPATVNPSGRTVVIPAGTTFEGRIESTIGSSVSKQGQSFTITPENVKEFLPTW